MKIEKMTETTRTTVTLNKSYMKLIEELVDVFGATKAQVISNIVEHFFNDSKNDALLEKLRERKRKEKFPEKRDLDNRIKKYLKRANKIPFEIFIKHLKLDTDFVINNLDEWGEFYNFVLVDNKITKVE
ncbi:MAG: hypothetical protein KAT66_08905 [Candidatus Lokiarchaeota archaeon]|nr:hypothetical protein [Candidatus Lokiarchaeota archaeon]